MQQVFTQQKMPFLEQSLYLQQKDKDDINSHGVIIEEKGGSLQVWFVLQWLLIPTSAKRQQRCHSDIGWPKLEILETIIPWGKRCYRNSMRDQENTKKNVNTVSSAWRIETILFLLLQCPLYCMFSDLVPRLFHSLTLLTVHNPSTRFCAYSTIMRILCIFHQVILLSMWSDFEKLFL